MSKGRKRPQISFLWSAGLLGSGIGLAVASFRVLSVPRIQDGWWTREVFLFFELLMTGPLIGAGLSLPFGAGRRGAYVGFFTPIIGVLTFVACREGWRTVLGDKVAVQVLALTAIATALAFYVATMKRIRSRRARRTVAGISD